jgi:hypothetical protein
MCHRPLFQKTGRRTGKRLKSKRLIVTAVDERLSLFKAKLMIRRQNSETRSTEPVA